MATQGATPLLALGRVIEHMRADLDPGAFAICVSDGKERKKPVATIHLTSSASMVRVKLEASDNLTHKELRREIDLSRTPPDAQPLAVALGATELLRASWAELELRSIPLEDGIDRSTVESARTTTQSHRSNETPVGALGAGPAMELFLGHLKQVGVDARLSFYLGSLHRLYLRAGARTAWRSRARDGSIQANAWLVSLGYQRNLVGNGRPVQLNAFSDLAALRCNFHGSPEGGATARSGHGTAWLGSVGAIGTVGLWRSLQLNLFVAGGLTLNGVSATDGEERVVGATGPFMATGASLDVLF